MDKWILRTVAEHGGVARRRDLVAPRSPRAHAVDSALARLLGSGRLLRVHRGLYALPAADRHEVTARSVGGALTCVSAAAALGLPLREPPRVPHVALPQNRGSLRTSSRAVIHRDAHVSPGATSVPLPLAIAHATRCLPTPEAVALVDGALNRGLVEAAELRAHRPRVGVVAFESALGLADGASQSFPESLARLVLRAAGLRVRTQARVPGVGRVDLLVEGLVIVEVDGRAYHSDRAQFAEDRRRDRTALAQGLVTLRFTYDDVLRSPAELVAAVRAALGQARILAAARERRA